MDKDKKKKEKRKDLLIYSSTVMIPLSLTIAGTTTIIFCDFPLVQDIILGGGTIMSGIQTISGIGNFHKDIINSFKDLKKEEEKSKTKYLQYPKRKC